MEWDLSDLYLSPEDPNLERDLAEALNLASSLDPKDLLHPSRAEGLFRRYEEALEKAYKPLNYASLYFATRTQDPVAKALLDRVRNRYTEVRNRLVPLEVALRKLPEEAFQALLEHPGLADLRHFLQRQRAYAPHTLSEREEELLNLKGLVGRSAWSQFYTEYTGRFRFRVGERELTEMEVRALRRDPDPKVRREAHRELYGKLMAEAPTLSAVFNAVFLDYLQDLRLRGYRHPLEPVALRDEVEVKDIEALLEATRAHYRLVEAYYRWKARRLGLEKTPSPDLLAPLAKGKPKVPFEEAQDLVLTAFHRFSPEVGRIAREFFEKRWIDAYPRPGKRGGAFCSGGLPSTHPYVLLNHTDDLDAAHTLAHELGHGVHFYLARKQRLLNFGASTPLAETASVFAEILLDDLLLERLSPEERTLLLAERVEDAIGTLFRQVMYTFFERRSLEARKEGALSPEAFHGIWQEEQGRLYGDAVDWTELDQAAWAGIPHFVHYRFYTYSYALGYLVVLALYGKYQEEGKAFVPKYLGILEAGESQSPKEILAQAGVDLASEAFFQYGFGVLESWLKALP
ncbi:M3 family oligoendopeptidase [Thermus scotoductus]|uniref:Oligoendopeptidase F n=1 Tax=Thermus scotoductus TaxID=37636 RepID=A0A430R8Z9_THESC|nr:M3 family oligoendopeptidase [Thermus scotoductus]RTG96907.1 oligoendopeptidase F [Thermus scotoductus]RTH03791.1 oligoendopeptidase F [Thermus scotoductus]RTH22667.1 oligoendopeptidase F [Thermus scotoductus]RTI01125.1 oligoendopeptidase F [Thermus scotoductus]RTI23640.1 oligoendopeptidase F [Thermus scotoductus]